MECRRGLLLLIFSRYTFRPCEVLQTKSENTTRQSYILFFDFQVYDAIFQLKYRKNRYGKLFTTSYFFCIFEVSKKSVDYYEQ